MDKTAKKLLLKLIDLTGRDLYYAPVSDLGEDFCDQSLDHFCRDLGLTASELSDAAAFLVRHRLAEYQFLKTPSGQIPVSIRLTHEGRHYKEIRHLTVREKWLERLWGFLSGVVVGILIQIALSLLK